MPETSNRVEPPTPDGDWLAAFPPRRRHLLIAAAVVVALYLLGVTNAWWPTPDSALYQGLGRNVFRGQGYRFNGQVNTLVAPGTPLIFGALIHVFGEGFWARNLFVALCGIGSLWLAYRTICQLTDRRMAFAAVLATALCYAYYDYSHLILTDSPFALLFWCAAYSSVRCARGSLWWVVPAALASAAAVLVRAPGLVALGALAVGIVLEAAPSARLRRRAVPGGAVLGAAVLTGAGLYLLARSVAADSATYVGKYLTDPAAGLWFRLRELVLGLANLPETVAQMTLSQGGRVMTVVGVLLLIPVVVGMVRLWRRGRRLAPTAIVLLVVGLAFGTRGRAVRPRYLMPVHPLLLWLLFDGVCWIVREVSRRVKLALRPWGYLLAATVAVTVVVAVNAPKVLRSAAYYSVCGHLGRYHEVIEDGKYADLRPTAAFLDKAFGPELPVAVREDRVSMLHFLGGCRTVPFKKVDLWNPWSAEQAERIYEDLRTRPELAGIVHDEGDLDERFARRLAELLEAAPTLETVFRGKHTKVYRLRGPLPPASRPSSRPRGRRPQP